MGSVLCDENLVVLDVAVKDKQLDSILNLGDKHLSQPPMDDSLNLLNLLLYTKELYNL